MLYLVTAITENKKDGYTQTTKSPTFQLDCDTAEHVREIVYNWLTDSGLTVTSVTATPNPFINY